MPDSPAFIGRVAVDEAAALYGEIVARSAEWGLAGLEVDWFMKQTIPFADEQVGWSHSGGGEGSGAFTVYTRSALRSRAQTTLGAVDTWIDGPAGAALAGGIPLQLCLSWPADALAALQVLWEETGSVRGGEVRNGSSCVYTQSAEREK